MEKQDKICIVVWSLPSPYDISNGFLMIFKPLQCNLVWLGMGVYLSWFVSGVSERV